MEDRSAERGRDGAAAGERAMPSKMRREESGLLDESETGE